MKNIEMKTKFITIASAALFIFSAVSCGQRAHKQQTAQIERVDILSWTQLTADEFGCMLEKTFGHRDERFNCSLENYENNGDPCVNYEEYYEGPEFPQSLVKKVHPWIKTLELNWENGRLQMIIIHFENEHTEDRIIAELGITPNEERDYYIMDIDVAPGYLVIQAFEHMGAGDVDCDEYLENDESSPWLGEWIGGDNKLIITEVRGNSFTFRLLAYRGGNTGTIEGKAAFYGNEATFTDEDGNDCKLEFELQDNSAVSIKSSAECSSYAGMGVYFAGEYKK
jgi:hypothetical protein